MVSSDSSVFLLGLHAFGRPAARLGPGYLVSKCRAGKAVSFYPKDLFCLHATNQLHIHESKKKNSFTFRVVNFSLTDSIYSYIEHPMTMYLL